uniref:Uncharacterized protein n=1 Tax=Octopus bimaculoides TaxID=37653 RepID=A0A0L8H6R0_OCTBM
MRLIVNSLPNEFSTFWNFQIFHFMCNFIFLKLLKMLLCYKRHFLFIKCKRYSISSVKIQISGFAFYWESDWEIIYHKIILEASNKLEINNKAN